MGQIDLDPTADRRVVGCRLRTDVKGNESRRLRPGGKRPRREPSFPGAERGTRDALTGTELGDRQTAGELSVKALPPGVCEIQVFGSCHERAPELEKGDQPSSIATLARLDLPCAYPVVASDGLEPQRPFRDIVVDRQPTVAHVTPQRRPLVPGIGHGSAQRRLGQDPTRQVVQLLLDLIEDRHRLSLPQRLALIRRELARTILDVVELPNPLQDLVSLARRIRPRLEELPARVAEQATSTIFPSEFRKIPS